MFTAPLDTKFNRWDTSIQSTVVKNQFKSVTDNCFIPHTCLGVTTAEMPLLKLHPVIPQGEACLGYIHYSSFLRFFYSRANALSKMGYQGFEPHTFIGLMHVSFCMQSMASWESAEVRGSCTESHRRECGGQELARDVAALVYELQKYIRSVFYLCPLICVSVKLV